MTSDRIRVLLVEDSPTDVLLISEALLERPTTAFAITAVEDLAAARQQLRQAAFEVVLLDLGLPDSQGLATLVTLREQAPQTLIIVLIGLADESLGLHAVQAGAQDYLVKGQVAGDGLARAIRYAIERTRAETENIRLYQLAQAEIAERQRVETTLRESQERLAGFVASAMDAIISLDAAQRIVVFNAAAEQMFGCTSEAALGQPIDQFIPAAFRGAHAAHVRTFGQTGVTSRSMRSPGTLTALRADGTEFPIEATISQTVTADQPLYTVIMRDISARLQAEAALRASEERYRQIVETSQEGIWQIDASNRTTFVNAKLAAILGYAAEEMIGAPLFAFMDAEGQAIAAANVERRRQGIAEQHDFKFRRKDGTPVWALISTNPVLDSAGNYAGALAMVTDITERKQAEEQLRAQADLLTQVSDAIIATDLNFTITSWNAAAEALYGWPAQDVIGKPMRAIVPTDYLANDGQQVQATFLREGHWRGEVVQQRRDGTKWSILSSVSLLKDHTGAPAGAVAVNRDITDRKRAEAALQRSAERLRVLADASRAFAEVGTEYQTLLDQVARTTATVLGEGCIIRLLSENKEWLNIVALCDRDAKNLELTRSVLGDAPLRVDEPSQTTQIFQSRQPLLIPVVDPSQLRMATKPEYWSVADRLGFHSLLGVPMQVQRQVIGVVIVYRRRSEQPPFNADDLTLAQDLADRAALAIGNARLLQQVQAELAERTKAEAEVRALSANLEQRVVARTAELVAANKELEAFSYSISHDLRSPLRAIDGFARILQEEYVAALPDDAQHFFQLLRDNAQQMGHLIDDLLAFSRLSRHTLARRSVDSVTLVRQCVAELHAEQAGRAIDVRIGDLPACAADPALLKQIWMNVLANALKYTRRRDPAVIEIGWQVVAGETIYSVRDNGVGFDMRYSDKLFGVFQRLHRAEDYEGTGVGLAIVQRIIHRHGGRIWAEAAVDQGAAFFFTLGDGAE